MQKKNVSLVVFNDTTGILTVEHFQLDKVAADGAYRDFMEGCEELSDWLGVHKLIDTAELPALTRIDTRQQIGDVNPVVEIRNAVQARWPHRPPVDYDVSETEEHSAAIMVPAEAVSELMRATKKHGKILRRYFVSNQREATWFGTAAQEAFQVDKDHKALEHVDKTAQELRYIPDKEVYPVSNSYRQALQREVYFLVPTSTLTANFPSLKVGTDLAVFKRKLRPAAASAEKLLTPAV